MNSDASTPPQADDAADAAASTPAKAQATRTPQVLRGFLDFLPSSMIARQHIVALLRDVFERHGFEPIDTPALEYYETLAGKYGEDEKLIYHFRDHGDREVGLRYDLTVPLARFVAVHRNELTLPFKRYHIGPVWRADRPQKGRYREFWQCDADIVGTRSMLADADVVSIVIECLQRIGMPNFVVRINHRKLLEATALYAGVEPDRAGGVFRAIDKLSKIGPEGVVAELGRAGVDERAATQVVELVSLSGAPDTLLAQVRGRLADIPRAQEALADLEQVFDYLAALGAPSQHYLFDLALARGLDYYTGPVFETTVDEPKIGSLGGAGRYDGLVGMFSGKELPATGMSLGLERIIDVANELGLLDTPAAISDAFVTIFDAEHTHTALQIVSELRRAGIRAETTQEDGRNLGRQLQYAGRRAIPFAVVCGPDELERGVVGLRNMTSGEQRDVPRADLAAELLSALGRSAT